MILVTGSLAFDHIMDFPGKFADHIMPDKIHILNVSFPVSKMRKGFGGTAGNIAYTLSLLGIRVSILGMAGEDFISYKEFLDNNEIDTSYIKIVGKFYTSTAFGITDKMDNQLWGFYSGADTLSDNLSTGDVAGKIDFGIIAPQNPLAMMKFALEYQKRHIPYLFDPGMQLTHLLGEDLKKAFQGASIIIGNDYEISLIQKKINVDDLPKFLGKRKIIISTLGGKGSRITTSGKTISIKPAQVKYTSDPTGAGDAYRAGFISGFMRGLPILTCGQLGSVAAAFTVEKYGTTTHTFSLEEFGRRYKENYGEEIKL